MMMGYGRCSLEMEGDSVGTAVMLPQEDHKGEAGRPDPQSTSSCSMRLCLPWPLARGSRPQCRQR